MSAPIAPRLTGLIFLAALAWGTSQGIQALSTPAARTRLAETLTPAAFLAGRTTAAVNRVMAHYLPADPWLRAAGGVWRWALFGSGGPQVRAGCGNWLFLTEELRPWPGADAAMASRVNALAQRTAALARSGITLRIVLVPDKSRVAQSELCGAPRSAQAKSRLAAFRTLATGQGLTYLDLESILRPEDFRHTDTHWTSGGAARAANAIAAAAITPAPKTEAPVTDWGDLVRLMSLDAAPAAFRPAPDQLHRLIYPKPEASGGLLDDTPAPRITLIGTSFSRNGQFDEALATAFGEPVLNVARSGGGFAEAARAYFTSDAFRETPPAQIIWEIPERVLGQPIGPEEAAFLHPSD